MSYSRSTRVVTGADGTRTETTTITGPDGTRTETRTIGGGGGGGAADMNGFSSKPSGGFKGFSRSHAPQQESRYKKGWSSKKKPSGPPMKLEGKTFTEIRDECLAKGELFEDPDFPAVDSSIFYSRTPPRPFVWKRPTEFATNPKLFVGGASRFDVQQGELGDCWLLAAIASLCQYEDLLYRVVPQDQGFTSDKKYAGIFHFQFWQYGDWVDIIVDDRLPTYYDKLVFMHSAENNEFWTALVEKAYAKLFGSYEALKGGATSEAMEDFTGGVTEMFDFRQNPPNSSLFTIMTKAYDRQSMMGCSIEAVPGRTEAELTNGLICGHAYSITKVAAMNIKTSRTSGKIPMVRIRNPWGNEAEWNGAWSDKSKEWTYISEDERKEIGLSFDNDGEFWMSFQDFITNFQKLEICNLGPDEVTSEVNPKKRWEKTQQDGGWKARVNAGGCRNYIDTFWTNPQYRIHVVDPDDDDDQDEGTVLIGLMQKNRRKLRKEGTDMLTMGYAIYKVPEHLKDATGPLDMRFFKTNQMTSKSPAFINLREVCGRHKLAPGHYCVVPSTFEPNQKGEFLMRIFTEKPAESEEVDEETGISDVTSPEKGDKTPKKPNVPVTEDDVKQNEDMRSAFRKIAGEDMEIDAYELQDIINAAFMKEFKFDGFSADTCRSMVAMMDVDQSGKLGFDEFQKLWNDLRLWKGVFKQFDKDRSGTFNSYELRQAFHSCGFKLSNSTFNALVMRYSHRDGKIYFDDMIHCICRLKAMFETFKEQDSQRSGEAKFSLDEFIQTTMYS